MKPMRIAYRTDGILFISNYTRSFTISLIRLSIVKSANFLILLEKYLLRNEIRIQLTTNYYLDYTLQNIKLSLLILFL